MALVVLVFMVAWNYDLHKILVVKSLTQNAGDASAIMAARWQGISLNIVGDLNLMQALALAVDDHETGQTVNAIQARLCYVGPMVAFMASQQAAKQNRVYSNRAFEERLREHARQVREDYPFITGSDGEMLFPEPYPGAWSEYAAMLETVANDGVAAGPDNARLYGDRTGGHTLMVVGFYEAIAGKNWCWFYFNAPDLLEDYTDFLWWPALPDPPHQEYINSEIYGLGLVRRETRLDDFLSQEAVAEAVLDRGLPGMIEEPAMTNTAVWYCYAPSVWTPWHAMATEGDDPFPATGPVRPQYNYAGADAVTRIHERTTRISPGREGATVTNAIVWTAAAKPFGHLNETDRPNDFGLVLPAFHEARLIPLDGSSAPIGGGYDLEWREHIEVHLPEYMETGPHPSDCWYCKQLVVWENPAFRAEGAQWLVNNSHLCTLPSGPGPGSGGGRRRAH